MFRKFQYPLLLLFIFLFHVYVNYEVLSKSEICKIADDADIFTGCVTNISFIAPEFPRTRASLVSALNFLNFSRHNRPFFPTTTALLILPLALCKVGINEVTVTWTANSLFLLILMLSVYGIGTILYNQRTGLFAVFLASFLPMLYGHTRNTLYEFPLTSMVALSFYLLFKTNKFQSWVYSFGLGIALGLTALTKESFLAFTVIPFLYYLYCAYKAYPGKKTIRNSCFVLIVALTIAVAGRISVWIQHAKWSIYITFFLSDKQALLYYFKHIAAYTGTLLGLALLPGFMRYLKTLKHQDKTLFLWFIIPLIVYNIAPNKQLRFPIPLLPAFALIIAQELFRSVPYSKLKQLYASSLILIACAQYYIYFHDSRSLDKPFYAQYWGTDCPGRVDIKKDKYYPALMDLLGYFKKEARALPEQGDDSRSIVVFLSLLPRISNPLQYKLPVVIKHFPLVSMLQTCPRDWMPLPGEVDWSEVLRCTAVKYVIDEEPYMKTDRGGSREDVEGMLRRGFEKFRDDFTLDAIIPIGDGSRLCVYKRVASPKKDKG
jgi:hypothetical protein